EDVLVVASLITFALDDKEVVWILLQPVGVLVECLRVGGPDVVLVEVEEHIGQLGDGREVLDDRSRRGLWRRRRAGRGALHRRGGGRRGRGGARGAGRRRRRRLHGRGPLGAAAEHRGRDEQRSKRKMRTARKHDASFWR